MSRRKCPHDNPPKNKTGHCKLCAAAYSAARRDRPEVRARHNELSRQYQARPDVKARRRERESNSEFRIRARTIARGGRAKLTADDLDRLLDAQSGTCALCPATTPFAQPNRSRSRGVLHLDHRHGTKIVRGLLCQGCNVLIGFAEKDRLHLVAPIVHAYLAGPETPDLEALIAWMCLGGPRAACRG